MNYYKIGLFALLIVFVGSIVYFSVTGNKNKPFNDIDLSKSTNTVYNTTNKAYLDTVAHVASDEMDIDNTFISITNINNSMLETYKKAGIRLYAFVIETSPTSYIIYINENEDRSFHVEVMSHEFVHIKQYNSNRLKDLKLGIFKFDGDTINTIDYEYRQLPWEKEAFDNQSELSEELENILWEK